MTLAVVLSRAQVGLEAPLVRVEVHITGGLPAMSIVGLAETAVKESKDRVRSALLNARFEFPRRRVTVNLAPADLPKEGGRFDLPIAVGILAASGQLPDGAHDGCEFMGELGLGGDLRPVHGVLPGALAARAAQRAFILPRANADEAALARNGRVLPADHLLHVCGHLAGADVLSPHATPAAAPGTPSCPDLADVRGQQAARRALEIAAAGGHNLLLVGPPGTGKTLLAQRLVGILPAMGEEEALETAAVHSLGMGGFDPVDWRRRPFRAPHHTASGAALVGGGSHPRPGEASLAHNGVLFLDELPEFDRRVLEVLREPLESGRIHIARAARQAEFPARFQLVAAMNPCPCGYLGESGGRCRCTPDQVSRYLSRVSGPLLDRIDLHVPVPPLPVRDTEGAPREGSAAVRRRVEAARERQLARACVANALLDVPSTETQCRPDPEGRRLLDAATPALGLSVRGRDRVLRVARSIADLAGSEGVEAAHVAEAINLRRIDRCFGA